MFQRVCNKCGKVIENNDKYMELQSETWQSGGAIWDEHMWLVNVHLCEKCAKEFVEWIKGEK